MLSEKTPPEIPDKPGTLGLAISACSDLALLRCLLFRISDFQKKHCHEAPTHYCEASVRVMAEVGRKNVIRPVD